MGLASLAISKRLKITMRLQQRERDLGGKKLRDTAEGSKSREINE